MKENFDETLLSAYLDGELSDSERQVVEEHLRRSPEARQTLKELGEVTALLRALPRQTLPEHFPRRVLRATERQMLLPVPKRAVSRRNYRWWVGAGAAAAAAAVLMVVAFRPSPDEPVQVAARPARNESVKQDLSLQKPGPAVPPPHEPVATPLAAGAAAANIREEADETPKAESERAEVDRLTAAGPNLEAAHAKAKPQEPPQYLFYSNDLRNLKPGEVADALVAADDELRIVEVTVIDVRRGVEEIEVLFAGARSGDEASRSGNGSERSGLHLVHVRSDAQSFERKLEELEKRNPGLVRSLAIDGKVSESLRKWLTQHAGLNPEVALKRNEEVQEPANRYHGPYDKDWRMQRRDEATISQNPRTMAGLQPGSARAKDAPLNVFLLVREPPNGDDLHEQQPATKRESSHSANHPAGEQPLQR